MQIFKIEIEPDFKNVDVARADISRICRGYCGKFCPDPDSFSLDFSLATTEAMNNAVEHSGAKSIEVEITATEKEIIFRMSTDGKRFDPTSKITKPDANASDDLPEGGFGLSIIKELVDSMGYEYINGRNILTIKKQFQR